MTNLERWLQARGRLIILFLLVVLPPAGTLVVLGIQLLAQDRVAARQRQTEFLEQASEKGVRILEQDLAERGFEVEYVGGDAPAMVEGDAEALGRALYNLVDNAAKYSGAGRIIEVTLKRLDRSVAIAVRDRGIGIPAAEQRRIFRKFERGAAAKSQGIQGTGIGLAMVRHIVDAHGGSVSVESAPGEGSTFTIVLPAKE